MLSEMAEMLKKTGRADEIVAEWYGLKAGVYMKVDFEGNILESLTVDDNTPKDDLYKWFSVRDYLSRVVVTNKALDAPNKLIHSTNLYTFFAKYSSIPKEVRPAANNAKEDTYKKFEASFEQKYYSKLCSPPENKKDKEIFEYVEAQLGAIDADEVNRCKESVRKCLKKIDFKAKDNDYINFFIVTDSDEKKDLENYRREASRYQLRKIFNKNEKNILVNGEFYGLSNENMGLSAKKPYLEMKSTKYKAPYRVNLEQALIDRKAMEWIENVKNDKGKNIRRFMLKDGFDFRVSPEAKDENSDIGMCFETALDKRTGSLYVSEYDIVPRNIRKLDKYFKYERYINSEYDETQSTDLRYILERSLDSIYFKGQMKNFLYGDEFELKGLSTYYVNAMYIMKQPIKSFFRLGVNGSLDFLIDKMTYGMVIDSLTNTDTDKDFPYHSVIKEMNMRLNLLRYFEIGGKKNMGDILTEVIEKVKVKVLNTEYSPIESDDEFYFCAGQLANYFCYLSEANNKPQSMYNEVLSAKNTERLKASLKNLYFAYNYKISINNFRFNTMYSAFSNYEPKSKINTDMIIGGLLSGNLLLQKKEEKNNEV